MSNKTVRSNVLSKEKTKNETYDIEIMITGDITLDVLDIHSKSQITLRDEEYENWQSYNKVTRKIIPGSALLLTDFIHKIIQYIDKKDKKISIIKPTINGKNESHEEYLMNLYRNASIRMIQAELVNEKNSERYFIKNKFKSEVNVIENDSNSSDKIIPKISDWNESNHRIMIINDFGNEFRNKSNLDSKIMKETLLIYKMYNPLFKGNVFKLVQKAKAKTKIFVINSEIIRKLKEVNLSKGYSWEKTIFDLKECLSKKSELRDLCMNFNYVIINFDSNGVVLISKNEGENFDLKLFFNKKLENGNATRHQNRKILGETDIFIGAFIFQLIKKFNSRGYDLSDLLKNNIDNFIFAGLNARKIFEYYGYSLKKNQVVIPYEKMLLGIEFLELYYDIIKIKDDFELLNFNYKITKFSNKYDDKIKLFENIKNNTKSSFDLYKNLKILSNILSNKKNELLKFKDNNLLNSDYLNSLYDNFMQLMSGFNLLDKNFKISNKRNKITKYSFISDKINKIELEKFDKLNIDELKLLYNNFERFFCLNIDNVINKINLIKKDLFNHNIFYSIVINNIKEDWTIMESTLNQIYDENFKDYKYCINMRKKYIYNIAKNIVIKGDRGIIRRIPSIEFGNGMESIDKNEIESINSVIQLLIEYLKTKKDKSPLNIVVFGDPGSGKSFLVENLTSHIRSELLQFDQIERNELKTVCYNISQIENYSELIDIFDMISDVRNQQKIPIVLFDEFDTDKCKWLKYFLAPMQDGVFYKEKQKFHFDKAIFVFAGGTCSNFSEFKEKYTNKKEDKVPDFISRLAGFIDIKGPNRKLNNHMIKKIDSENYVYRKESLVLFFIRRAILIRNLFLNSENAKDLLFGDELNISDDIIRALLEMEKYEFGVRSIKFIIKMSRLNGRNYFDSSLLPAKEQLALHVNIDEFYRILNYPETINCPNFYLDGIKEHDCLMELIKMGVNK